MLGEILSGKILKCRPKQTRKVLGCNSLFRGSSLSYGSSEEIVNPLRLYKLESRAFIGLKGEGTSKVINNLTTNDYLQATRLNGSQFTAFLNSKGRTVCDAFIYNVSQMGGLDVCNKYDAIIDISSSVVEYLMHHVKKYSFRSGIEVVQLNNILVHQLCGSGVSCDLIEKTPEVVAVQDQRAPGLGVRIISNEKTSQIVEPSTPDKYTALRISHGIPESPKSIILNNSLPLELNLDLIKAISWKKGCYLGQELTFMTHARGAIRKRLMPVQLYKANSEEPMSFSLDEHFDTSHLGEQEAIVNRNIPRGVKVINRKPVNTLLADRIHNIALAIIRLEELYYDSNKNSYVQKHVLVLNSDPSIYVKVFVPSWFPATILKGTSVT